MNRQGWWRRNRWGLLALIPMLAAAGWVHYDDVHDSYWASRPREPVAADASGWVFFAGARIRLVGLEPATDLRTFGGEPFQPPAGVAAWRATIVLQAPDQEALTGCALLLEDAAGNTYEANPRELDGARVPFASCTADDEPAPPSYETVAYFATPVSAQAAAVRVTVATRLPRYARLTPSG